MYINHLHAFCNMKMDHSHDAFQICYIFHVFRKTDSISGIQILSHDVRYYHPLTIK